MFFSLKTYKDRIIFHINEPIIDDEITKKIINHCDTSKKIGVDMENVKSINSKFFISCLLEDRFKLYNLENEVLIYLAIIMKDGFLKSYMSSDDLYKNKREFIKRHFLVA